MSKYDRPMKLRRTLFLISQIKERMGTFIISELESRGIKGMVGSHGDILAALYQSPTPLTMKEIAQTINRTQPTVTVLVDKLVALGYLTRIKNPNDLRSKQVKLTQNGIDFKDIFFEISGSINTELHKNISSAEADQLEMILQKIVSAENWNKTGNKALE